MKKLKKKIPTISEFEQFRNVFERHLALHVFVKKTIDFLSPQGLKALTPMFKDARLYSENIYSESEAFFRSIANHIGKASGYSQASLTCLTQNEFEEYLSSHSLPNESLLAKRYIASALYFYKGQEYIVTGKNADATEAVISKQAASIGGRVKGICAFPGKIVGTARVVPDPFSVKVFRQGDILITGMTRPEFLPIIRKSAAVVTDVGGALCHAAITSRELKKPCIVGTGSATKVFRDGDMVEVDAEKGIVRKIGK